MMGVHIEILSAIFLCVNVWPSIDISGHLVFKDNYADCLFNDFGDV